MWEILNKRILIMLIVALGLLTASCKTDPSIVSTEVPETKLLDSIESVTSGDSLQLVFTGNNGNDALLQLDNSYGSVLLSPKKTQNNLEFTLPDAFLKVAGICSWKLIIGSGVVLEGDISILPKVGSRLQIESYLGPKDLIAGSSDRPMVVTFPTDQFDNPLPDGTVIEIEERYKGETISFTDTVQDLIHWRRIQPRTASGRIFVKSTVGNNASVEMYTDISPGMPTDFDISFERNHEYADGNQVLILETSVIKDAFDNTVADGTQVTFQIQSSNSGSLFSNATTVNGVATAKIVHPDAASSWRITAFVTGAATSNTLDMEFATAVMAFDATYDNNAQVISIGPVNGFMGQLVPDFTPTEITIFYADGRKDKVTAYTHAGYAQVDVNSILSDTPPMEFEIRVLGLTKRLNP